MRTSGPRLLAQANILFQDIILVHKLVAKSWSMAEEIFELVLNTPLSHTCVSALMEAGCELNNNLTESRPF